MPDYSAAACFQGHILSKLGVDARHLSLLNAWVRCDQFLMSHETSHLQALHQSLRAQTSTGSSDSAEMSLADHAHSCRLMKKLQVRSGIGSKLGSLAQDAFKTLTAAQLPIVLDIMRACSTTPEDVGALLHEAVNNSTERELCRLWSEELHSVQAGTVRVLDPDQLRSRISAVKVCLRIITSAARWPVRRSNRVERRLPCCAGAA